MAETRLAKLTIAAAAPAVLFAFAVAPRSRRVHSTHAARRLYVSPQGAGKNPGTRRLPFRTLRQARDRVRRLLAQKPGAVVVEIAGGVYRLRRPLRFRARDSAPAGQKIIYRAAPGARVVISGGARITGWRPVPGRRHLWSADAPAGFPGTRQLYINGVRARRARGRLPARLQQTPTGYIASNRAMVHWRNPAQIEFVYTGGNGLWSEPSLGLGAWTEPRCPVAQIQGRMITMAEPCWRNSTARIMLPRDSRFHRTANLVGPASVGRTPAYAVNVYEFLGAPGQWYFDPGLKKFYYTPRAGENLRTADVEAPVLQTLIEGAGSVRRPLRNLEFQGLRFEYAGWLYPSTPEGFSEIQANYMVTGRHGYDRQALCHFAPRGSCPFGAWTPTPGNLAFRYDHGVVFQGDVFAHLGAAGLALGNGSQHDRVIGCVFTDISGNGLDLGNVNRPQGPAAAQTADNTIADNHIYNVAAQYHGGVGIDVGYARHTHMVHNQLDHLPYTAISIGWGGWPDKIHRSGVDNYSRNNLIAHNLIYDHMLLLADGGGIYTQGRTGPDLKRGEKIIANVVRDQFSSGHAIYTDNGSSEIKIARNIIFHTNFDNWGSRHHDYYHGRLGRNFDPLAILGNYWQQGDRDSQRRQVVVEGNHLITSLRQAPAAILRAAGLQPAYRGVLKIRVGVDAAPAAPQRLAAWAGRDDALVSWNPPAFNGGAPIRSYTVKYGPHGAATISAAAFMRQGYIRIAGLTPGHRYRFTVEARNRLGLSSPALPSARVVAGPKAYAAPGPPARVWAFMQNSRASIHWQAPQWPRHASAAKHWAPIVAYIVTVRPGLQHPNFSAALRQLPASAHAAQFLVTGRTVLVLAGGHTTFISLGGLRPGVQYRWGVSAVSADGQRSAIRWAP